MSDYCLHCYCQEYHCTNEGVCPAVHKKCCKCGSIKCAEHQRELHDCINIPLLEAERDSLAAEVERLKIDLAERRMAWVDRDRWKVLAEQMKKFSKHEKRCTLNYSCECGLAQLLEAWPKE